MAEETLQYSIEIDRQGLAAQLEEIRQQIDATMGAMAFQNDVTPSAQALANAAFIRPDVNTIAGNNLQNITVGTAQSQAADQSMFQNMASAFDRASQQTQLGFSRFQEDARLLGLLAQPRMPSYAQNKNLFMQGPEGLIQSVLGSLSPGLTSFDRDASGMTRAEYQRQAAQNVASYLDPFENSMLFSAAFAAGGFALGGFTGAFTGFGVGSMLDLASATLGARASERESLRTGLSAIAQSNFGRLASDDSRRMAEIMQNAAYSFQGRATGVNLETLQENVLGFANAGGFSNVTNAMEMEEVLQSVVDNTRRFANNFKLKQQEAVQVMAQLSREMVVDPQDMGDFSSRIATASAYTGMAAADMVGFGLQGVNMMQGTGMARPDSFNMALDARLQAERLRRQSPEMRQTIMNAGGVDQFALNQMQTTMRFMTSGQGMLMTAGLLSGAGLGSGLTGILSGAGDILSSDPGNFFRITGSMGQLSGRIGLENAQALQVGSIIQMAQNTNLMPEGTIDQSVLRGLLMQFQGVGENTAQGLINTFLDASNRQGRLDRGILEAIEVQSNVLEEADYGVLAGLRARAGQLSNAFFETRFVSGAAEFLVDASSATAVFFEDRSDRRNNRVRARTQTLSRGVRERLNDNNELIRRMQDTGVDEATLSRIAMENFNKTFSDSEKAYLAERGVSESTMAQATLGMSDRQAATQHARFLTDYVGFGDADLQSAMALSTTEVPTLETDAEARRLLSNSLSRGVSFSELSASIEDAYGVNDISELTGAQRASIIKEIDFQNVNPRAVQALKSLGENKRKAAMVQDAASRKDFIDSERITADAYLNKGIETVTAVFKKAGRDAPENMDDLVEAIISGDVTQETVNRYTEDKMERQALGRLFANEDILEGVSRMQDIEAAEAYSVIQTQAARLTVASGASLENQEAVMRAYERELIRRNVEGGADLTTISTTGRAARRLKKQLELAGAKGDLDATIADLKDKTDSQIAMDIEGLASKVGLADDVDVVREIVKANVDDASKGLFVNPKDYTQEALNVSLVQAMQSTGIPVYIKNGKRLITFLRG